MAEFIKRTKLGDDSYGVLRGPTGKLGITCCCIKYPVKIYIVGGYGYTNVEDEYWYADLQVEVYDDDDRLVYSNTMINSGTAEYSPNWNLECSLRYYDTFLTSEDSPIMISWDGVPIKLLTAADDLVCAKDAVCSTCYCGL